MPTRVEVIDLVTENASRSVSGVVPFQYYSPTMRPSRVSTRQSEPASSARAAIASSAAGSTPASAGSTTSQSGTGHAGSRLGSGGAVVLVEVVVGLVPSAPTAAVVVVPDPCAVSDVQA